MDSTTERILICRRISHGPASVPSIPEACFRCGEPVWVAGSRPAHDKVACTECAAAQEDLKLELRSEEQLGTLAVFQTVTEADFESIKGLSIVIERLLDSLRNLRREHPELFFGQPVEGLYTSLEAALASFYRSRVSEEPVIDKMNPSAS